MATACRVEAHFYFIALSQTVNEVLCRVAQIPDVTNDPGEVAELRYAAEQRIWVLNAEAAGRQNPRWS